MDTNKKTRNQNSLGDYQSRVDGRRDRLEQRADKAEKLSNSHYERSKSISDMIPFGQPILVGHHSEKRARRDADRIFSEMGKSVEQSDKAKKLKRRADSVGSAGIASDDPEAIAKLEKKLINLKSAHETMKMVNTTLRKKNLTDEQKIEYIMANSTLTRAGVLEVMKPDYMGRVGFAPYALTNNNKNIKNTEQRIEDLKKLHDGEVLDGSGCVDGIDWQLCEEDGRVKFIFEGKPSDETRAILKGNGFNWSRFAGAWIRKITPNAIRAAETIKGLLG